jgi:hypothetical protein
MIFTPLITTAFGTGRLLGQLVDRQAMRPGPGAHFDPTISQTFFYGKQCAKRSSNALAACRRFARHPPSLQPRARLRVFVPNALAAPNALVHPNGVAVSCVEQRMGKARECHATRAATMLVAAESFARNFVDVIHGVPPRAPSSRKRLRAIIVAKRVEMRPFAGAY